MRYLPVQEEASPTFAMFLPRLARRDDVRTTLLVGGALRTEITDSTQVKVLREDYRGGSGRRFYNEQRRLPDLIRRSRADVLLSTGNFALYCSASSANPAEPKRSIYFIGLSARYAGSRRLSLMDRHKNKRHARPLVGAHRRTVPSAPSATFAGELQQWSGKDVAYIHHGFDHEAFFPGAGAVVPGGKSAIRGDRRRSARFVRQPLQLLSQF